MSRRSVTCTPDRFAAELDSMLAEVADGVCDGLEPVVRAAADQAVDEAGTRAAALFGGSGRYARGFRRKVSGTGSSARAEVGHPSLPGLVHLLEKGHATIGGGRVAGREHVAPAADAAFEMVERGIDELVGRVL